jgi:hypothetical protein
MYASLTFEIPKVLTAQLTLLPRSTPSGLWQNALQVLHITSQSSD